LLVTSDIFCFSCKTANKAFLGDVQLTGLPPFLKKLSFFSLQ